MSREITDKKMLIGELSHMSGFSKDTLRYYEKIGIIKGVGRKNNSYREYGYETLKILEVVHVSKDLGFTLMEVRKFIEEIFYNDPDRKRQRVILRAKLHEIDRQIEELKQVRKRLEIMIKT
jgi:DNA-binding transcriptional MerR regulator